MVSFLEREELWNETQRSHAGTHVFVVQVEQYTTNSLSLAGVNRLCKHFTLRIDIFKLPRGERSGFLVELPVGITVNTGWLKVKFT